MTAEILHLRAKRALDRLVSVEPTGLTDYDWRRGAVVRKGAASKAERIVAVRWVAQSQRFDPRTRGLAEACARAEMRRGGPIEHILWRIALGERLVPGPVRRWAARRLGAAIRLYDGSSLIERRDA